MQNVLGRSVSLRLIILSLAWIVTALAVGGWVLAAHFEQHVERSFDAELERNIADTLAFVEVVNGRATMRERPANPNYNRPLSGWYWQLSVDGGAVERSRSLWDQVLEDVREPASGEVKAYNASGPGGEELRMVVKTYQLSNFSQPVSIAYAGPLDVIEDAAVEFSEALAVSMLVLGLGLLVAVVLQIIWGLRPLSLVRTKLADVHAGEAAKMDGEFPSEVEALVNDLNSLLDHNAQVIERARTHTGNLAHALKTPLAVLSNEADKLDENSPRIVREQVQSMNELVKRHLARARAAGGLAAPGQVLDLAEVLTPLQRTLVRIYQNKNDGAGVAISLNALDGFRVAGEREDLDEMLGNLLDNACKWAASKVEVTAQRDGRQVLIRIADDGPGIADEATDTVLQRGKRLDEATPGSGLGLAIVLELAELYHGSLRLRRSDFGGLEARLRLPAQ
ncbi:sensor histidine kinase [Magnetovibrio sp. PR-2]|uniref:sensor histidine kinase n=1 Tax=Magnetovibrio sp. PR-2 TaxID=3120356 RepID=UPI002FCE52B2